MTKDLGVRCQVSGVRTDGGFSVQPPPLAREAARLNKKEILPLLDSFTSVQVSASMFLFPDT